MNELPNPGRQAATIPAPDHNPLFDALTNLEMISGDLDGLRAAFFVHVDTMDKPPENESDEFAALQWYWSQIADLSKRLQDQVELTYDAARAVKAIRKPAP